MGAKSRSATTITAMAHRHYQVPFVGDGVTVEFPLTHSLQRADDLNVYLAGLLLHPATPGSANDYAIRGLTPGYIGDMNRVKFTVAPGMGIAGMFIVAGG